MAKSARSTLVFGVPILTFVAIASCFSDDSINVSINPILATVSQSFPDIPYTTVVYLTTAPKIIIIPFALLSGYLAGRKVSFRALSLIGFACIAAFGVLPIFLDNFWAILASRLVLGVGLGIQAPLGPALIMRYVLDDGKRAAALGVGNAVLNASSIGTGLLAGFLADVDWHLAFLLYALMLIPFLLVLIWLKEPPRTVAPAKEDPPNAMKATRSGLREMLAGGALSKVLVLFVLMMTINVLMQVYPFNLSRLVQELGIGSSALSGALLTFFTVGCLLGSLAFGLLHKIAGYYSLCVSVLFAAAGCFIGVCAQTAIGLAVGLAISGMAFNFCIVGIQNEIGAACPREYVSFASALFMSFENMGSFIMGFYVAFIMTTLGFGTPKAAMVVSVVLFLVLAAVLFLMRKRSLSNE